VAAERVAHADRLAGPGPAPGDEALSGSHLAVTVEPINALRHELPDDPPWAASAA
jgi:hypothetical protein